MQPGKRTARATRDLLAANAKVLSCEHPAHGQLDRPRPRRHPRGRYWYEDPDLAYHAASEILFMPAAAISFRPQTGLLLSIESQTHSCPASAPSNSSSLYPTSSASA